MGKKVLILSGSPRRNGNSDHLCDEFMRGAVEAGNEVEKIFISGKRLEAVTYISICVWMILSLENPSEIDGLKAVIGGIGRRDCH